jgi:hypothetical protein
VVLQGERTNTVQALWSQPASQITQEQHNEFYRFVAVRSPRRLPLPPPPPRLPASRAARLLDPGHARHGRYNGGADPDDGARDCHRQNAYDSPRYHFQFMADAPIAIQ